MGSLRNAEKLMGDFVQLSQALATAANEDGRMKIAVEAVVSLVEHCDHAGLTLNQKGELITRASSDDLVALADRLQTDLGEGPCLEVGRGHTTIVSVNLAAESRWPRWAPRVHNDLRVDSLISLLVHTEDRSFGALSLYARHRHFDADDVCLAQALAEHMSVVMAAKKEIDDLGLAVHSRNVIGQAQGVLMERYDITSNQAFDYLRRLSSHSNRKIITLATEIVTTRTVPDVAVNEERPEHPPS